MDDEYLVLAEENSVEIKIKGSRFIASGCEIETKETADLYLKKIQSQFYDATHNCFAFCTGSERANNFYAKYSDDGEPSGTAGSPIMKVILGEILTNTIIVVTRYFGGTKLGTGGLMRAYSTAAKELILATGKKQKIIEISLKINYEYDLTSPVMHLISNFSGKPEKSEYGDQVLTEVKIRKSQREKFIEDLNLLTNSRAKIIT